MKTSNATLFGIAALAGMIALIKKAKNQPKGAINIEYISYEEIKKQIDLNNRALKMYDSHTDISVGKNNIGYYVTFRHYGLTGNDGVASYYITSDTYMKLRTEDGIPVNTEDVAVSGIGDVPVWNKGHIRNWLAYEHYGYPEKIIVTRSPYYLNDGCVAVWSYTDRDARNWQYNREFSVREKDIDYLRMLCQEYRVEFIEL